MRQITYDFDSERDYEAESLTDHQVGPAGYPGLEALGLGMILYIGSLVLLLLTNKLVAFMGGNFLAETSSYSGVSLVWAVSGAGIQWWRSNRHLQAWRRQFKMNIELLAMRRESMHLPKLFSVSFPRHRSPTDLRNY